MPTVIEKAGARKAEWGDGQSSVTREYDVSGVTSELAAIAAIRSSPDVPADIDGAKLKSVSVDIAKDAYGDVAGDREYYSATVQWERSDAQLPGEGGGGGGGFARTVKFTTRGGTKKITSSLGQFSSATDPTAPTPVPESIEGAINAREDGGPDGADIIAPNLEVTIEREYGAGELSTAVVRDLYESTGTVNDDTFLGAEPGELLFSGADGTFNPDGSGNLTFSLLFEPNLFGQDGIPVPWTVSGERRKIDKQGWDYFWVYSAKTTENDKVITRPVGAFVERVYRRKTFSSLPIL